MRATETQDGKKAKLIQHILFCLSQTALRASGYRSKTAGPFGPAVLLSEDSEFKV